MTSIARDGVSAGRAAIRGPIRSLTARGRQAPWAVSVFLRRDLAEGTLFRASLVLDISFGLINLVGFLFISRVLHHPGSSALGGAATYFDFVAVGLAYLLVVQATCGQQIARIQEQQRSGTLEFIAAQPVSPHLVAVGLGLYPTLLGMLRSMVYLAAAVILLGLNVQNANWWGLIVIWIVGTVAALGVGIGLAACAVVTAHGGAAGRLTLVGLGFLSGAYFPVAALPSPLRGISAILPTRMAIDGLRTAMAGGAWAPTALLLAATTVAGFPVSTWLFGRALRYAQGRGTLVRA